MTTFVDKLYRYILQHQPISKTLQQLPAWIAMEEYDTEAFEFDMSILDGNIHHFLDDQNFTQQIEHFILNPRFPGVVASYSSDVSKESTKGYFTLSILEIILYLQANIKPSKSLINNALSVTSQHINEIFLGVRHILTNVTRYKSVLNIKQVQVKQHNVKNSNNIITKLDQLVDENNQHISCVIHKIVKTPQTRSICLHKIYNDERYVLYDPHPRYVFNGSHFLIFSGLL